MKTCVGYSQPHFAKRNCDLVHYRAKPWYRERFVVPASALIAATGIFWTVQRIVA